MESRPPVYSWVKTGGICGLIGGCMYFLAAFVDMPPIIIYATAFSFPPLIAIGCTGLFYFFSKADNSPRLRIAWVSAIAGGLLLLAMMTVQQTIFSELQKVPKATYGIINPKADPLTLGLSSLQPGLELAWDVLIPISLILFSVSMLRKSWFWKITGATGLVLALLLLIFNLYYFPIPPIDSVSVDWGPFIAIWLLFVFATLLTSRVKLQPLVAESTPEVSRAHYY